MMLGQMNSIQIYAIITRRQRYALIKRAFFGGSSYSGGQNSIESPPTPPRGLPLLYQSSTHNYYNITRRLRVSQNYRRFSDVQSSEFSTQATNNFDCDNEPTTNTTSAIAENNTTPISPDAPGEIAPRSTIVSNALEDKIKIPLGELPIESFLDLEDALNKLIRSAGNDPTMRQLKQLVIKESIRIYRRLIQEVEHNPELLDDYEMTHWIDGNYPRSVKLLDDILGVWYKWWTKTTIEKRDDSHNNKKQDLDYQQMLEIIDNLRSGSLPLPITDRTYTTLIRAATNRGDPKLAPMFADQLLDRMLEESLEFPTMQPSTNTMNAVLHAWAKSGLPEAPEKVEHLFRVLCEQFETGVLDNPPDNSSYTALMLVWSRSERMDAASKVEDVLNRMKDAPWENVIPDTEVYRAAIHSWVNSEDKSSSLKVYSLFVEIVRSYMASRDENVMIDGDLFSIVISKLAKERHCEKAEEIFQLLEELYELTDDNRFKPSPRSLLGMVIAYSHSKKAGAAEKAESMIRQVESLAWQGEGNNLNPRLLPKRGYYADVIIALSKSRNADDTERAVQLLLSMIDLHRAGATNILPDKFLFDHVLTSLAGTSRPQAAQRSENLLKLMHDVSSEFKRSGAKKPNEYSYLQVINAWSKSQEPEAPKRAEEVFHRMLAQYNETGDKSLAPNLRHYTSLIACWARSKDPDAPNRAQTIFDAAVELHEAGDESFKPDRFLYVSLMRAWSDVGAASKVEAIFLTMYEEYSSSRQKSLMPNALMFNIMLAAWLRSDSPEAQHKATILFDSMVQFSEDKTLDDVAPDGYTYLNILKIILKSQSKDSAEQCEKYLQLLKSTPILKDRRGHQQIFSCYVSTLAAWYRRADATARTRKEALVDELTRLVHTGQIPLPSRSDYVRFLGTVAMSKIPGKSDRAVALLRMPRERLQVSRDLL